MHSTPHRPVPAGSDSMVSSTHKHDPLPGCMGPLHKHLLVHRRTHLPNGWGQERDSLRHDVRPAKIRVLRLRGVPDQVHELPEQRRVLVGLQLVEDSRSEIADLHHPMFERQGQGLVPGTLRLQIGRRCHSSGR